MAKTRETTDEGRRSFLKLAASAAPAAAVTAVAGGEVEASESTAESTGLRKTAHVEAYLASARF
jgi:hypothetical protein